MTNRQKAIELEISDRTLRTRDLRSMQAMAESLLMREESEIQKLTAEFIALAEAEAKGEMEVVN